MKCIAVSNVMLIYELRAWVETTKFYCGLCREWLFCVGEGEEQKANRHRSTRLDQDSCLLRLVRYYFIIYLKLAWEVQGMRMG